MKSICRAEEVANQVRDGSSLLVGGFLGVGCPERLVDILVERGPRNLTLITNDTARPGLGVGKLIDAKLVRTLFASHIGTNPETQRQMLSGELEVELVPQGTLVERIRCAGFGLGGVLTKTGLGTLVSETKRKIEILGEEWLLDTPLKADFALIHAHRSDFLGNLTYHLTADNFNSVMAMAGRTVIAEADELVAIGEISPDEIRTPGILVDYILERRK
jgi:acetate CoA/acetoacetate CoA-transferase alpha subunit